MTNPTTEDMTRTVWEFFTGGAWHCLARETEIRKQSFSGMPLYEIGKVCICCKSVFSEKAFAIHLGMNPPLATSLNDWHEHIFPVMSDEQTKQVDSIIYELVLHGEIKAMWRATAMHHLQAAYAVVKGE